MSPTANGDVVAGEAAGHRVRPGGPVVLRRLRRLGTLPAALLGAPALDSLAAPRLVGLGEPGRADDAIVAALDRQVPETADASDVGRAVATAPLPRSRPPSPPRSPTDERASVATAPLPRPRLPLPPPQPPRLAPSFDMPSTARGAGAGAEPSRPTVGRAAPPFAADAPTAWSAPTDVIASRERRGSRPPEAALAWSPLAAIGATTPPCPPERETVTPALRRALGADATGPSAASRPRPIASGSGRATSPNRVDAAATAAPMPPAALAALTPSSAATTSPPVVTPSGPAPVPVEPTRVRGLHGLVEAWNGGAAAAGSGAPAVEASASAANPTSGSSREPREDAATGPDFDTIVAFGAALEVVLAGEAARHGIEVAR